MTAAVILQYHHVSSETPALTSVTKETFLQHMHYLKANHFKVIPLPRLIDQLRRRQSPDDKTVVITFDDGYLNVYHNARPILNKLDWPYTIFINPRFVDQGYTQHMSWTQLRRMGNEKATIANHTMDHDYLVRTPEKLSDSQWLQQIEKDILQAERRIAQQTGQSHKMLAYPYGEFTPALEKMLAANGFSGFGQHSGAVGLTTRLTRIPRFPASGIYARLDTLGIKINSLPLAVTALTGADPVIEQNPPTLGIGVDVVDFLPRHVQCFSAGSARATVQWQSDNRFTVIAGGKLPPGRSRYNCTAPSLAQPGRYYWFSQPWINSLPRQSG